MPDAEEGLSKLLDTVTGRLRDAMTDMNAAVRCIEAYKEDPEGAQTCIIEYLRTGETAAKLLETD